MSFSTRIRPLACQIQQSRKNVLPAGLFDPTLKIDELEAEERRRLLQQRRRVQQQRQGVMGLQSAGHSAFGPSQWTQSNLQMDGSNVQRVHAQGQRDLKRDTSLAKLLLSGPTLREALARDDKSDVSCSIPGVSPLRPCVLEAVPYESRKHTSLQQEQQLPGETQSLTTQHPAQKQRELRTARQWQAKPLQKPEGSLMRGQRQGDKKYSASKVSDVCHLTVSQQSVRSARAASKTHQLTTQRRRQFSSHVFDSCHASALSSVSSHLQVVQSAPVLLEADSCDTYQASQKLCSCNRISVTYQPHSVEGWTPTKRDCKGLKRLNCMVKKVKQLQKKLIGLETPAGMQEGGSKSPDNEVAQKNRQCLEAMLVELADTLRFGAPEATTKATSLFLAFLQREHDSELNAKAVRHLLKRVRHSLRQAALAQASSNCLYSHVAKARPQFASYKNKTRLSETKKPHFLTYAHRGRQPVSCGDHLEPSNRQTPSGLVAKNVMRTTGKAASHRRSQKCPNSWSSNQEQRECKQLLGHLPVDPQVSQSQRKKAQFTPYSFSERAFYSEHEWLPMCQEPRLQEPRPTENPASPEDTSESPTTPGPSSRALLQRPDTQRMVNPDNTEDRSKHMWPSKKTASLQQLQATEQERAVTRETSKLSSLLSQRFQLEKAKIKPVQSTNQNGPYSPMQPSPAGHSSRDVFECLLRVREADRRAAETLRTVEEQSALTPSGQEASISASTSFKDHEPSHNSIAHHYHREHGDLSERPVESQHPSIPAGKQELPPASEQRIMEFSEQRRRQQLKDEPLLLDRELQAALQQLENYSGGRQNHDDGLAGVWTLHANIAEHVLQQEVLQAVSTVDTMVNCFVEGLLDAEAARMTRLLLALCL